MLLKNFLLVVIFIITTNFLYATHIAGADLTYKCLGGDTFLIKVNTFRDCSGISLTQVPAIVIGLGPGTDLGVRISLPVSSPSPCSAPQIVQPFTAIHTPSSLPFSGGGGEVSQLCDAELMNSRCNSSASSALPGMVQHVFEAIVILPPCNSWTLRYEPPCCRNSSQTLVGQQGGPVVTAILNNLDAPCNNSPEFNGQPIPYVCVGYNFCYNFGTTEQDGDSLVYKLVGALSTGGNPANYHNLLVPTHPILSLAPVTLNPLTGELCFVPVNIGNNVVVIEVSEYRNGILIGKIMRDFEVVVQLCSNQAPSQPNGIAKINGNLTQVGQREIEVCRGQNYTLEIPFKDLDVNDSLELRTNVTQVLQGATFTVSYPNAPISYDTAVAIINWTAIPSNNNVLSFFIEAKDGACPIFGFTHSTFTVELINSTLAGPDQTICHLIQSADIEVVGGNQFQWNIISGDLDIATIDTSSQTKGKKITVSPKASSCYQVVSDLSNGCKNMDTICVRVVPNYNLNLTNDTLVCEAKAFSLGVKPSDTTQNYQYKWSNEHLLDDPNKNNPTAKLNLSSSFTVTVESDSGCVKVDSVTVEVSYFAQNIKPIVSDSLICENGTVDFDIQWDALKPNVCGPAVQPCTGNASTYHFGDSTGINSTSSLTVNNFPAPFYFRTPSAKQQFLYKATDLLADGMQPGQIQGISFTVVNMGSLQIANNYTVRMACTIEDSLTYGDFSTGLTLVRSAAPLPLTSPITNIPFDSYFDWDGLSNLIVEICFDNTSINTGLEISASTPFKSTTYNSTAFSFSNIGGNASNQCISQNQHAASPIKRVPLIQFTICNINDEALNISWLPSGSSGGFTTATDIKSPSATVNFTTDSLYTLIVSDTIGVCSDTSTLKVIVVDKYDVKPIVNEFCENGNPEFFSSRTPYSILPKPNGGTWTGTGIINDSLGLWDPSVSGVGSFWVYYEVLGNTCSNRDSSIVEVFSFPAAPFIGNDIYYCEGDAVAPIIVNSGNSTTKWYSDSLQNNLIHAGDTLLLNSYIGIRSFYATSTNGKSCESELSQIKVRINPLPFVSFQSLSAVCENIDSIILNAGTPLGGVYNGVGVVGNMFSPIQSGAGNFTISYTVTDSNSCKNSDSSSILVYPKPAIKITIDTIISNNLTELILNAGTNWQSYEWSTGDKTSTIKVNQLGNYFVTVTDSNTCQGIADVTISVYPGITQIGDLAKLKYYPNPTNGECQVSIEGLKGQDAQLSIFSLDGKLIEQRQILNMEQTQNERFDFSLLSKGVYLIRLTVNSEFIVARITVN